MGVVGTVETLRFTKLPPPTSSSVGIGVRRLFAVGVDCCCRCCYFGCCYLFMNPLPERHRCEGWKVCAAYVRMCNTKYNAAQIRFDPEQNVQHRMYYTTLVIPLVPEIVDKKWNRFMVVNEFSICHP